MTVTIDILIGLLALGLMGWSLWQVARTYLRFRGTRVVTCPETGQPAAIELATWRMAVTATVKGATLRLKDCSRWRERAACDQACRRRIEAAPEECLVLTILSKWYQGKTCTCCGRPLGEISQSMHRPCLMSPDMRLFEWKDIPAESIPGTLATHAPVCWTCLVAETHTS